MKLGTRIPIHKFKLNKWYFRLYTGPDWNLSYGGFAKIVTINLIKLKTYPPEGATLSRNEYNGIIFQFSYFCPIRVSQWR